MTTDQEQAAGDTELPANAAVLGASARAARRAAAWAVWRPRLIALGYGAVVVATGVALFRMRKDLDALGAAKILGLAVAAASAIWGLAAGPTLLDGAGRRRLTAAGHVAILLVLSGVALSIVALGFESVAEQEAKTAAAKERLAEAAERRANAAEVRAKAAEIQAALEKVKLQAATTEAAEKDRDLALARSVNEESQRNLAQTRVALVQLGRLLKPVGEIKVVLVWQVPGSEPGLEPFTRRLRAEVARMKADPAYKPPDAENYYGPVRVNLKPQTSTWPQAKTFQDPEGAAISFFSQTRASIRLRAASRPDADATDDIVFSIPLDREETYYSGDGDLFYVAAKGSSAAATVAPDNRLLSLDELGEARIEIRPFASLTYEDRSDVTRGRLELVVAGVTAGGRTYPMTSSHFKRRRIGGEDRLVSVPLREVLFPGAFEPVVKIRPSPAKR